jgi:hypothetical protein
MGRILSAEETEQTAGTTPGCIFKYRAYALNSTLNDDIGAGQDENHLRRDLDWADIPAGFGIETTLGHSVRTRQKYDDPIQIPRVMSI